MKFLNVPSATHPPLVGPRAACLLIALAATACASVPEDAGFSDVQQAIRDRTGFEATWKARAADPAEIEKRVKDLLGRELSERDAVDLALLRNPRLQAAFEGLGIAGADLMQAGVIRNPILSGEIRFPNHPFELILTQTILDLIQLPGRKKKAAAEFEAAKLRAAREVVERLDDVRTTFFELQGAEQVRALWQRNLVAARARAELAARQFAAGTLSQLGSESEQALQEEAELHMRDSELATAVLRERLNALMGTWGPEASWTIRPELPAPTSGDADLQGLESMALENRLDLAVARQEVEAAARAVPYARSLTIGEMTAGIHVEREPTGETTTGPALEFPIPIFDRGRASKNKAEALWRRQLEEYAALGIEARAQVRSAAARVTAARVRYEYFRDVILPRRQRITESSLRNYNYMLLGPGQLVLARQNELESEREALEALKHYWLARVELESALGSRLPEVPGAPAPQDAGTAGEQE